MIGNAARLPFDELSVAYRLSVDLGFPSFRLLTPLGYTGSPPARILLRLDCSYTLSHWVASLSRRWRSWELVVAAAGGCGDGNDADADAFSCVAWIDEYETIDWSVVLSPPYRLASSFCVRKGLGRKAAMAPLLESHTLRCGPSCALAGRALPRTHVIDTYAAIHARPKWLDLKSALAEALSEADEALASGGVWILKPSMTNKGAGIALVNNAAELRDALTEAEDAGTFVLQEYLLTPFLVDPRGLGGLGHKFHLRVYVLAVGALEVHVFKEALVLFAPRPYGNAPTSDLAAHLTNSCLGSSASEWDDTIHVRALSELPNLIGGGGAGVAIATDAFEQVAKATAHAFAALEGNVAAFLPAPACFELYGVDFLLDAGGCAVLLEFNPSPDVRQTGTRLDDVIARMIDGVATLALDAPRVVRGGTGGGGARKLSTSLRLMVMALGLTLILAQGCRIVV